MLELLVGWLFPNATAVLLVSLCIVLAFLAAVTGFWMVSIIAVLGAVLTVLLMRWRR